MEALVTTCKQLQQAWLRQTHCAENPSSNIATARVIAVKTSNQPGTHMGKDTQATTHLHIQCGFIIMALSTLMRMVSLTTRVAELD